MVESPAVTIGIDKAVVIYEAVVLRLFNRRAPCSDGFAHQIIHPGAAFTRQGMEDLQGLRSIADRLGRELTKLCMREKHEVNILADDEARGSVIGELRVPRITDCLVKGQDARQTHHGQGDENLGAHTLGREICGCKTNVPLKEATNEGLTGGHLGRNFRE